MSTFLMRGHWGQLSGLHLDVVHNCCCLQWHWPWQCWHKASYVSGDEEVESTCRPMKAWLKKKKKSLLGFIFPEFTLRFYLPYRTIMSRLHCIKTSMNVTHFGAKSYKDNLAKNIFIQIKRIAFYTFWFFWRQDYLENLSESWNSLKPFWLRCLRHVYFSW